MNKEKHFKKIIGFPLLAIISSALIQHHASGAGVISVCDDSNLRAAVTGGGLVTFTCGGTIVLTNEIVIANDTVLDATGQSNTISGGNLVRLFKVNPGVRLELRSLTLADGFMQPPPSGASAPASPGLGGAIFNDGGTIILNDCRLLNNVAVGGFTGAFTFAQTFGDGFGGAIWSSNGIVCATNTYFGTNIASGAQGVVGGGLIASVTGKGSGGALYQSGGQTVFVKCQFQTNAAIAPTIQAFPGNTDGAPAQGGALWHTNGALTLLDCEFTSNLAWSEGAFNLGSPGSARGGSVFSASTFNASNCCFAQNIANAGSNGASGPSGEGGALWLSGAAVISSSTFTSNSVQGGKAFTGAGPAPGGVGRGGAIYNQNTLVLVRSLLAFNEARGANGDLTPAPLQYALGTAGFGGALFNSGTALVTNITFSENRAIGGAGALNGGSPVGAAGNGNGGGLYNRDSAVVQLSYCTFAGNAAIGGVGNPPGAKVGGGIQNSNGTVTLSGTIVANSPSGGNAFGSLTDNGYNLSSDATCAFAAIGSLNNTDPVVSPLADFGGPTLTIALLAGSPAINGGNPANYPATDQRGRPRPFGAAPDIGASESSSPYSILGAITGPASQNSTINITSVTNAPVTNGSYGIHDLSTGTYSLFPTNNNYLIIPNPQTVTVGPDRVGINFSSYPWNTMIPEITNGFLHLVFGTTNGPSFRTFASSNLIQWSAIQTNYVGTTNYGEIFIPLNHPAAFYRAVVP